MTSATTKYLTLTLILALVTGLVGTIYQYNQIKTSLTNAQRKNKETHLELSNLTDSYDQLSEHLLELKNSNAELESRINEIEQAENTPPIIEKPDIVLEILSEGNVKNVILLIGDGMGPGQITAAELMNGEEPLTLMSLPYMSMVTTYSSSNYVTDSAASATALATGSKTNNGMISMTPSGEILKTVIEIAEERSMATGIVTNTRVTHATPAAFMAHVNDRNSEAAIAQQVVESKVDVVLGGGSIYFKDLDLTAAGYTVVDTTNGFLAINSIMVFGLFATDYMSYDSIRDPEIEPSLAEMTRKSIELLSIDPDGFFLMVEGGRIDHASHANDFENTLSEVYAFDSAVLEALVYASGRNDTLIIVTADHETGGLLLTGGYSGGQIQYSWISDDHTASMVPVLTYGPKSEEVLGFSDNSDIGSFLIDIIQ